MNEETLEQFVDALYFRKSGTVYDLARAVEQRTAERCVEIAEAGIRATRIEIANAIRREFHLEPNQ